MLLIGLLIAFLPLTLLLFFKDKKFGFLVLLTAYFGGHFLINSVTQLFGLFNLANVSIILATLLIAVFIALFLLKRKVYPFAFEKSFLLILALIFIQFWSIHYHYKGPVQTQNGIAASLTSSSYSYPMFSDEWGIASWVNYSIESGKLPLVNTLSNNKFFLNLLFPFPTTVSGLFLLLDLDPVYDYAPLPIFLGMIVIIASYVLLRSANIHYRTSIITISFLPLISQAGNLPGLWVAIPYTLGLLFFIVFLSAIFYKSTALILFSALLSFIFYPPIIIFLFPVVAIYLYKNNKIKLLLIGVGVFLISLFPDIYTRIIRDNIDGGVINFPISSVIPKILIPFILWGLYELYKKRKYTILVPTMIGLIFWVIYKFYSQVVIIEYPRVVIITSILLILTAAFSLNRFEGFFSKKPFWYTYLLLIVLITINYPINNRNDFYTTAFDKNYTAPVVPGHSVSRHLIDDDIRFFSNFTNKVFMAPPWKGLVLALTTKNKALHTKPSIISTEVLLYKDFMSASCSQKKAYIKKYNIEYLYSAYIDCSNISKAYLGKSQEGLHLYRIVDIEL